MRILKTVQRVPGGMMLIPLLLGAILNTCFPMVKKVTFADTFTGGLMSGAFPILGVFFLCMGTTIDLRATPHILKKGGVLLGAKLLTAAGIGYVAVRFLGTGQVEVGPLAGLSVLAIVSAMNDTNGGLYMALMAQFGKKEDVGAYSIMSLESGAFFTMMTLGLFGTPFPWEKMLGAILPLILGMVLGNLDRDIRDLFGKAVPVLIPFFAFALGCGLDLTKIWQAGFLGVLLGVMVVVITGVVLWLADRLTGGNGIAGLAAASTAGNAAAVPLAVASASPYAQQAYGASQATATGLVAASVVVTAVLVPIVTAWWAKRLQQREPAPVKESVAV